MLFEKSDGNGGSPLPNRYIGDRRTWLIALLVSVGYYAGALFGFALTFHPIPISILWPPNALLMAALLLMPVRSWWLVLAAALPAHLAAELQSGVPTSMVLAWFVSNSAEALIGGVLIRGCIGNTLRFDSVRHIGVFLLSGAFIAPFVSSFLDSAFVYLLKWGEAPYWQLWRSRFFSNMLAAVLLVPFIVSWCNVGLTALRRAPWHRYGEAGLLALGVLVVIAVMFVHRESVSALPLLLYAPMPFLIWAAVRFGVPGVSAALLSVAALTLWKALHHEAPFVAPSPVNDVLPIQLFLIVVSASLLFLAAAISEQARVRRALARNQERLQLALSAAQIGAWDWHLAANQVTWSGPLLHAGETDESVPTTFEGFTSSIHPHDRRAVLHAIDGAIAAKTHFEKSFRVVRPDGEVRWIRCKGQVFQDADGRAVRVIGVNLDFTGQRRNELKLTRQRQEITYLNRVATLGELSGSLAHELCQPLTAILANANAGRQLLAREPLDITEQRAICDDIIHDSERAGDIIRGLHALFKDDPPQFQSLDVNQLVRDVLALAQTDLLVRGVEACVELAPDTLVVHGDRIQLQQVLLNLVVNASEAMADVSANQRKLTISTEAIAPQTLRISVADRGPGIPADRTERLFEAFFTTKKQGLGLGLSICRSIVLSHGGRLWATNGGNGGAVFHVELPDDAKRAEEKQRSS